MCCMKTNQNLNSGHCIGSDCNHSSMPAYHRNSNLLHAAPTVPLRLLDEQVWDLLRVPDASVTVSGICDSIDISYYKAKSLLDSWIKSGHAKRTQGTNPKTSRPQYAYEIVRDCGQEPPQVDGKGDAKACSGNELVWRTLRILKVCNANQIADCATDSMATLNIRAVRQYLRQLHIAGYLMMVDAPRGQLAVYRLMHDTGPRAPEVQRGKKIYDGNLGLMVYDPETPLPPSQQLEASQSKQKQAAKKQSKQEKKERRHV